MRLRPLVFLVSEWSEDNGAEFHRSVIALQNDGARLTFMRVRGNGGKSFNGLMVDYGGVVQDDGNNATHEPDVERLPFTGSAARVGGRQDAAVQGSVSVQRRRLP